MANVGHPDELYQIYSERQLTDMRMRVTDGMRPTEVLLAELTCLVRGFVSDSKQRQLTSQEILFGGESETNPGDQFIAEFGRPR